jgi:hypothetical protein
MTPQISSRALAGQVRQVAPLGLLAAGFIGGLGALAALVPVGHGLVPKGGQARLPGPGTA